MRYEHIELDISTEACDALEQMISADPRQSTYSPRCEGELHLFLNQLRARLQRRDVDPHCPLNTADTADWMES